MNAKEPRARNFGGPGTSPEAALGRELSRNYQATLQPRPRRGPAPIGVAPCPECGAARRTAETLRVHRWIAHDVQDAS